MNERTKEEDIPNYHACLGGASSAAAAAVLLHGEMHTVRLASA